MNPCSMRLMSACASPWGVGGTGGGPRGGHGAKQQKNPFSAPVRGIPGSKALWTGCVNESKWMIPGNIWRNTSTNTFKLTKQLSTGLSSMCFWESERWTMTSRDLKSMTELRWHMGRQHGRAHAAPVSLAVLAAWPWSESDVVCSGSCMTQLLKTSQIIQIIQIGLNFQVCSVCFVPHWRWRSSDDLRFFENLSYPRSEVRYHDEAPGVPWEGRGDWLRQVPLKREDFCDQSCTWKSEAVLPGHAGRGFRFCTTLAWFQCKSWKQLLHLKSEVTF